jgi:hypothetical protein
VHYHSLYTVENECPLCENKIIPGVYFVQLSNYFASFYLLPYLAFQRSLKVWPVSFYDQYIGKQTILKVSSGELWAVTKLCETVVLKGTPLWPSGQSSWLQNGDVLCFLWGTNWIYICYVEECRQPLWSNGQSSWLQNGDVLCFMWGTNWIYICYVEESRPPLWSSGQSYWPQSGDVLCFLWGTNWIYICYVEESDHLCGLVVRVLGYRSGGPGSINGTTRKKK